MTRFSIPQPVLIMLAMLAGLIIGGVTSKVYLGVDSIANAFVLLLQMTALPYITLSLIVGIGGLTVDEAKGSFKQSIAAIVGLSVFILGFIFISPIAFPDWENAGFYSANTVKPAPDFDIVSMFIPANPFNAFATTVIPSVVVFSIFIGIGLMLSDNTKKTLQVLGTMRDAVAKVSALVMKFAPFGVFCIALRASATVDTDDINGLLVYVVTTASLVLFLCFAVLPAITAVITPFSYRQILSVSQKAMITAFATGSFFIVIPTIVEESKRLIKKMREENNAEGQTEVDKIASIIVPITFSLPVGGKMLALLFTLFAGWFSGAYISNTDYANLLIAGIPQLFGTSTLAMPALLDLLNVSSAMFDLFLVSENLIVGRLSALLSVIFATCLPLIIAASLINKLTFDWKKFSLNIVVLPLLAVVMFAGLRYTFDEISYQYKGYEVFIDRDFLYPEVPSIYLESPSSDRTLSKPYLDVLSRVEQRGFLRVGYFRDDLPYSFHNKDGKLVGFDIEIMNQLAEDLNVGIEFVKIFHDQAAPLLASGYLDITSGIPVIPDNMKNFTMTVPYSTQNIAFIVKDERRAEFTQWEKIIGRKDLIIGIPETYFYKDVIEKTFTNGKAWEISTPRLFFQKEYEHIDGMLFGAAAASAWTLLNPEYTVIVPKPAMSAVSMAFPINKNDHVFELFMRNWIQMKQQSQVLDSLFKYWIEGKKNDDISLNIKPRRKLTENNEG